MEFKQHNIEAYNRHVETLAHKYERGAPRIREQAELFVQNIAPHGQVLDLGAGPGAHAAILRELGVDVLCGDLSEEMVKRCRERGLRAVVMDMEELPLLDESLDGVWQYASLLHIPHERAPLVVGEVARVLRPGGVWALSVKEGLGEGYEDHPDQHPGNMRWFTYHTRESVQELVAKDFDVLSFARNQLSEQTTFLNFLLKKSG